MSTTPFGPLHLDRADRRRLEHAEPAALDHRRAAHADVRVLGGDHHVAAAEDRRVAGEAVAGVDADERHGPRQLGEPEERQAVEPADTDAVGVAGAAAAALGEEHDRQAQLLGELEQAVLLAVVLQALGAGEHGVVVRHRDAVRVPGREQLAVDGADAADQAVGRACGDEVLELATAALGGDDERAVLDERALVDEVGDVLPRRAPCPAPATRHGVGAGFVEADSWRSTTRRGRRARPGHLLAGDGVQHLLGVRRRRRGSAGDQLVEQDEAVAGDDGGTDGDQHLVHDARAGAVTSWCIFIDSISART